jgi:hypothetical protein
MRVEESHSLHEGPGTNGGDTAYKILVSPEDEHFLSEYTWRAEPDKRTFYAVATTRGGGKRTTIRLHRLIVEARPGQQIDHVNGNGLDCRRENLRLCSTRQNCHNKRHKLNGTSRFKGVSWSKRSQLWQAQININGKPTHLGFFTNETAAAMSYDSFALEHFGAFALLNFPQSLPHRAEGGA